MKKIIFIFITILLSAEVYSQNENIVVSGYVKDSLSAEALIGVTVGGTYAWTTTNNYGFYSLSSKKADTISLAFHYMGYRPVSKKIPISNFKKEDQSDSYELNIDMVNLVTDISEAVVTGSRPAISSVEPLGKLSVNSSQLKYIPSFLGEQDIFKYLQLLPGVSAGKEASTGLNVRGGSSDQTLILLDDIPIYNHSHGFGFVSVFSGETIKSAELYKGYIPPSYGGRLSGVATMIMKDGNRNEHKQSLQLGTTTISGTVEGPINKGHGSYLVNARLFSPGLFLKALVYIPSFIETPYFGFYDVTAKANYDLNKNNTLYLSFYTGGDTFANKAKESNESDNEGTTTETLTKARSGLSWGNIGSSLRLSSKLSNKSFLNSTIYYSYLYNNEKSDYSEKEDGVLIKSENSTIFSAMHEIGAKTLVNHNISNWYNLSYGINISYQSFIPMNTFILKNGIEINKEYGNRGLVSSIIFLNNDFKFGKFGLNIGARLSMYYNLSETIIKPEPRVSLSYNMRKSSIWLSYVENTQPLFSMNQYSYSLPVDYWVPFTEKNIIPTSRQLALGYKQKIGSSLDLYTEVYYKRAKDISLVYNVEEFLLENSGYDVAENRAYGFEVMAQYQKNRLGLMGSYTYSRSEYNTGDKWFPFMYDTPHNINIFGSYDVLRRQGKTHTLSCNINFKSGIPYFLSSNEAYPSIDNFDIYGGRMIENHPISSDVRQKPYFRMDVSYSMEKKLKKGSRIWQISILNLTGYKNTYSIYMGWDKVYENGNVVDYKPTSKGLTIIPFLPSFSYKRMF